MAAQRRQDWQLVQQVEAELAEMGRSTFVQLANEAARYLRDQYPTERGAAITASGRRPRSPG
jgi:hypothetical protein